MSMLWFGWDNTTVILLIHLEVGQSYKTQNNLNDPLGYSPKVSLYTKYLRPYHVY